jgi:hypothetical protein
MRRRKKGARKSGNGAINKPSLMLAIYLFLSDKVRMMYTLIWKRYFIYISNIYITIYAMLDNNLGVQTHENLTSISKTDKIV